MSHFDADEKLLLKIFEHNMTNAQDFVGKTPKQIQDAFGKHVVLEELWNEEEEQNDYELRENPDAENETQCPLSILSLPEFHLMVQLLV